MKFHKAMGFIISGAYQESMYKFGQWRDVLWMGKSLRPHLAVVAGHFGYFKLDFERSQRCAQFVC